MSYNQFIFCNALNFIRNHIGQYLTGQEEKLIVLCSSYLQEHYDMTARSAERMSIIALSEIQDQRHALNLEINEQVVYVRDPGTRETYALTASILRKIAPMHGMALKHS